VKIIYKIHAYEWFDVFLIKLVDFQLDFLSEEEACLLAKGIDDTPWDPSQSGRRKQVAIF
jgi:hypothetical protein